MILSFQPQVVQSTCITFWPGFNENYGYGYHDYDFAKRWMQQFGRDSIIYAGGEAYHIGSGKPEGKNVEPSPKSIVEFNKLIEAVNDAKDSNP